jgi:probable phosphoglycerate mutase
MKIFLIRHGQKEVGPGDPGLTEKGQQQAKAVAEFLASHSIERLLASPLKRTQQTAQAIAQKIQKEVETHPHLTERANWGDVAGQSWEEFVADWKKMSADPNFQHSVWGSSRAVGDRISQVIDQLWKENVQSAALITHGGAISDFLRNVAENEEKIKEHFENSKTLSDAKVPECSVTELAIEKGKILIHKLFATDHLPK